MEMYFTDATATAADPPSGASASSSSVASFPCSTAAAADQSVGDDVCASSSSEPFSSSSSSSSSFSFSSVAVARLPCGAGGAAGAAAATPLGNPESHPPPSNNNTCYLPVSSTDPVTQTIPMQRMQLPLPPAAACFAAADSTSSLSAPAAPDPGATPSAPLGAPAASASPAVVSGVPSVPAAAASPLAFASTSLSASAAATVSPAAADLTDPSSAPAAGSALPSATAAAPLFGNLAAADPLAGSFHTTFASEAAGALVAASAAPPLPLPAASASQLPASATSSSPPDPAAATVLPSVAVLSPADLTAAAGPPAAAGPILFDPAAAACPPAAGASSPSPAAAPACVPSPPPAGATDLPPSVDAAHLSAAACRPAAAVAASSPSLPARAAALGVDSAEGGFSAVQSSPLASFFGEWGDRDDKATATEGAGLLQSQQRREQQMQGPQHQQQAREHRQEGGDRVAHDILKALPFAVSDVYTELSLQGLLLPAAAAGAATAGQQREAEERLHAAALLFSDCWQPYVWVDMLFVRENKRAAGEALDMRSAASRSERLTVRLYRRPSHMRGRAAVRQRDESSLVKEAALRRVCNAARVTEVVADEQVIPLLLSMGFRKVSEVHVHARIYFSKFATHAATMLLVQKFFVDSSLTTPVTLCQGSQSNISSNPSWGGIGSRSQWKGSGGFSTSSSYPSPPLVVAKTRCAAAGGAAVRAADCVLAAYAGNYLPLVKLRKVEDTALAEAERELLETRRRRVVPRPL